jgi:putative transposase
VDLYVLVFINVGSRRVWISPPTAHPNSAWVAQQGRNVCMHFQDEGQTPSYVMRDADTKYTRQFDGILQSEGIKVKQHTPVSPNLNAYVERLIQSIQQECLDHFIVCGERHFEYLIREYLEHYHTERPHQSKGNVPLVGEWPGLAGEPPGKIVCRKRLGGLLRSYTRRAA